MENASKIFDYEKKPLNLSRKEVNHMDENQQAPVGKRPFNPIAFVVILILVVGAGALLLSNSHKAQAPATNDTMTKTAATPTTAAMKQEASPSGAMAEG